jgi:hypothetical protein
MTKGGSTTAMLPIAGSVDDKMGPTISATRTGWQISLPISAYAEPWPASLTSKTYNDLTKMINGYIQGRYDPWTMFELVHTLFIILPSVQKKA